MQRLSPEDREHCQDLTTQLLDRILYDCDDLGLETGCHAHLDSRRWKKLQTHTDVTLYADRGPNAAWLPVMSREIWENPVAVVAVGELKCSLDDVLLAVMTPDVAAQRLRSELMGRRSETNCRHDSIVRPTQAAPFQSLVVTRFVNTHHWPFTMFVGPREMVLAHASGEVASTNGRRCGYELIQSVVLRDKYPLSKSLPRSRMVKARVFYEQPDGSVVVYNKLIVDAKSRLPDAVKQGMLCRAIMTFWKFVPRSVEMKKLRWCIKNKKSFVRTLQASSYLHGCAACGIIMRKSPNHQDGRKRAAMTTLEEAKAFLKKDLPDGTNLYDHLGDVLLKIIVERPENLHETFENISTLVKQQRYLAPQQPAAVDATSELSSIKKLAQAHQENWCNVALELLKIKSEEEAALEPATGVADLLDEANMFEWAGLGFSKGETFRLSLALQRLAQTNSTVNLRFWGKLLGRGTDYYVAEGELPTQYEPEDLEAEEGAAGVNKLTYWVLKDNGAYEWVQLPPVRQEQILVARQLRRYVRGDLDAPVLGHPPFPGLEKNFLRAQIARISAGTVLCPAGYFQVTEEGDITPAEEPEIKAAAELVDLGSWTHFTKEINARYGRMTPLPPQTNADGEEEPREGEEFAPPLRVLSEDKPLSWRVDRLPATLQPAVGEVAVVRSLVWPGAVSIAVGKKFLNVYVGNGVKFLSEPFQLPPPQRLQPGSSVGLSEDAGDGESKPALHCEVPVEQPDLLEDPAPLAEEEE
ncbi:hypothetical protein KRP22_013197 [Phytophthora ramorum]|nr:Radial spoke head protein 4-like protein A [Phytophthora ramorum]